MKRIDRQEYDELMNYLSQYFGKYGSMKMKRDIKEARVLMLSNSDFR